MPHIRAPKAARDALCELFIVRSLDETYSVLEAVDHGKITDIRDLRAKSLAFLQQHFRAADLQEADYTPQQDHVVAAWPSASIR